MAMQAQSFASWRDLILYRQVKRSAMSDSIRRLLHGTLGRSFAAWSNTVHERAALKQKGATCLARLAHAHVASAFTAWLEWAAEQKDHRCAAVCGSMHICCSVACPTAVILGLCKCLKAPACRLLVTPDKLKLTHAEPKQVAFSKTEAS